MKNPVNIHNIEAKSGEKAKGWLPIAESPTSLIQIPVLITNGVEDGPVLFLNSGTHACEYSSIEANIRLQKLFDPREISGAIISSPITNIASFNNRTQYVNPIDGKNINTLFPGKKDGTISDRIAYVIFNEFIKKADVVIDLHGGDFIEDLYPMNILYLTGDPGFDEKMLTIDKCFSNDFFLTMTGSGGIASESVNLKKPALTVEAGGLGQLKDEDTAYHVNGVINAMKYLNMIEGAPVLKDHKKVSKIHFVNLSHGGIWHSKARAGDIIAEGQTLGEVTDVFGEIIDRVIAPNDGVILFYMYPAAMHTGETVFVTGQF